MPDISQEPRRMKWTEYFGVSCLFRAFRLAISPTKLFLAFCGVLSTFVAGEALDVLWPRSSQPVLVADGPRAGSELEIFTSAERGGRRAAREWMSSLKPSDHVEHVGAFSLLLGRTRLILRDSSAAVLRADYRALFEQVRLVAVTSLWLVGMHTLYALIFLLLLLIIWSYLGGAVCRMAALEATRDERIGVRAALAFAKGKFASFFAAPLMPVAAVAFAALFLFIGGLIGSIPAVGEVVVGLLFILAIIAGAIIAFITIGAVAGCGLMFPTIAVEGSDAFDSLARSFSYVYLRPWRLLLYTVISAVYGLLCYAFLKFFARMALWMVGFCLGASMNWGSASVHTAQGTIDQAEKLTAMWREPAMFGTTPFWGEFGAHDLAGASWVGGILIRCWVFLLATCVASFLVSFFYSAGTLVYLLLRWEVDATDFEDVYLEEEPQPAPAAASASAGGPDAKPGDTSLPVIGSS